MQDATTASRLRLHSVKFRCEFRYKSQKIFSCGAIEKRQAVVFCGVTFSDRLCLCERQCVPVVDF